MYESNDGELFRSKQECINRDMLLDSGIQMGVEDLNDTLDLMEALYVNIPTKEDYELLRKLYPRLRSFPPDVGEWEWEHGAWRPY